MGGSHLNQALNRNLVGSCGRRNKVCEDPADLPETHLGGGLLHDLVIGVWEDPQRVLAALLWRLVDSAHHCFDAQRYICVLLIPDIRFIVKCPI